MEELLKIQREINETGPEEFRDLELITLPELRNIRRIWVHDKHEFDDSVPKIYERVMGKPFEDPEWIETPSFGEEEWNLLKEACDALYPDEELAFEMAYSLLDVENQSNGMNNRKGIIDSLESVVKQTFYKNEPDATAYYRQQLERKKNMGGTVNEKFFSHIYDEGVAAQTVAQICNDFLPLFRALAEFYRTQEP